MWDFSERFQADVVDDFISEYAAGRTPNPCLRCNEKIKFAALLERAIELGFDAVDVSPLSESWRVERDRPAYVVRQSAAELRENLDRASRLP